MTDIVSKDKRSEIMRANKNKRNKSTELRLIELFRKYEIKGWRRNYKIIGHPDFVFLKKKVAVFTDGCFWHGHDCRNTKPSSNKEYWDKKISENKKRDKNVSQSLSEKGWTVIRFWECELKKKSHNKEKLIAVKSLI